MFILGKKLIISKSLMKIIPMKQGWSVMQKDRILIFLCFILICVPGFGQKTVRAYQFSSPPVLDGILSEEVWNLPDSAAQFIQMEPFKGNPESEKTVVYSGFDEKYLYFGFKCYDSTPSKIVSDIRSRDVLSKSDDLILVLLDTYTDKRSAVGFFVNPVGSQVDMKVGDDGKSIDINWDTKWDVAAVITDWGWSAEFIIPFTSIGYDKNLDTWGINFGRVIRKNAETVYWSGELNDDFRVSQGGLLTGIKAPQRKHTIELTPYTTIRYENSDLSNRYNEILPEIGLDAGYNISSNIKLNAALNPDFATVEGDQEQINLTRWELRFPEKRLFFLEGNELFSTRIRTFYSRRIGDINYGGKVFGKIKDYNLYLMGVRSRPDTANNIPAATFSVLRVKKDILKSSTLGVSLVDKRWENNYSSSASLDYVLNLGKTWKLTGQWVGSFPGDLKTASAWYVRVARESNIYHYHIRYSNTGKDFMENVNHTGFMRDDDMRELDSDITYKWWFDNPVIKYLDIRTYNNIFWNHQGTLRSWYITEKVRLYLQNRFSMDISYNNEFKLYEKKYYNHKYGAELGYNTDEWASSSVNYTWGINYDRDFTLWEINARVKPTENLSLEYSLYKLDYSPDLLKNSTTINILTADYNFTRDLWIRVLAQNNSGEDRIYFYGLFGWRFKPPFGALYLIYTSDRFELPFTYTKQESNILYLKFSYQFGIPGRRYPSTGI